MNGSPAPRPALKKAADAHIHPAAPGHKPFLLRHAGDAPPSASQPDEAPDAAPDEGAGAKGKSSRQAIGKDGGKGSPGGAKVSQLSRPLAGNTSDSLRRPKRGGGRPEKASGKKVTLSVKIPKSLRKEFNAALKAERKDADAVVTSLLSSWLHG